MEFTKDDNTLELLPNNIKIKDSSDNSVTLNSKGCIDIDYKLNSFTDWNTYFSSVNINSYHGSTNNIDLSITGGNISLGNPKNAIFSGRFRHYNFDISNNNEDFITSRFIGTQTEGNNSYNTSTRYTGVEILTNYNNDINFPTWNENLNFYTTKNASYDNPDISLNSFGNLSASIACQDRSTHKNTERFGSFIINPPSTRNILTYSDSMAHSHLLYSDIMKLENMKLNHNYKPSQQLEINNGNIAFTSYYNSNTANNSFNNSNENKSNTLNKGTITGLNQIIYDVNGTGSFNWKWGNGIGSFLNYGRGYYEFPEEQLSSWTGNGNNEVNTDLYHYNNTLNNNEKKNFRRTILNNVMMAGMVIEQDLNNHKTFVDENSTSGINSYNTDIENKQPPSESLHFITYSKYNKEWLGESVYKGSLGSKLTIGEDAEANIYNKKSYGGEIRMTIKDNGYIGIGTTQPNYPLEINNYNFIYGTFGVFLGTKNILDTLYDDSFISSASYNNLGGTTTFANYPISTKMSELLLCRGVHIYSDERIKTDVENVPDSLALEQINKLETKYYNYKDPLQKKEQKIIGFMAQETKKVIPNAVTLIKDFIPDELRIISEPVWLNKDNKWQLVINDLDFSNNHTGFCRFHLSNDITGNKIETKEIKVQEDNKTFIFDTKYEKVVLWGKEVNDFHTIDKNMIFALHHSAIQELDRKHKQEVSLKNNKIELLEKENIEIKERLKKIEEKLSTL